MYVMKKLKNLLLLSLLVLGLSLVSCGGANLKAIDEKIQKDGMEAKFSSGEYNAMIGFIEKLIKDNPHYDPSDEQQMEKFGEDFGNMFTYMMVLGLAKDKGDLSSSQIEKLDIIQKKAAQLVDNSESGFQEEYEVIDNKNYGDFENSKGTQKLIVDQNGNIVGDYAGETETTYVGFGQDEFEVPKSNHKVIEISAANGEGVIYCKEPGDVVKVYAEPSINSSVIGNMIYEPGELPLTYECMGKNGGWYKIRFNHKTGYVLEDLVEWSAEDYF